LAVGPVVVIRQGSWGEEGGALIAVQGAVLASQEVPAAVFTHSRWAVGTIGFARRHFGEEAYGERNERIKKRRSHFSTVRKPMHGKEREEPRKVILYRADQYMI
jgi:hypothetical protein